MTLQVSELPFLRLIGSAADPAQLAALLVEAAGCPNPVFSHSDRVLGADFSIRLLFQKPVPSFTKTTPLEFPQPFSAERMAEEFFIFSHEARYGDRGDWFVLHKGWEVLVFKVDGESIVVVQAVWVNP